MHDMNQVQPEREDWCVCYCGDDGPFLARFASGMWYDNEDEIVDVQWWEYAPTP